jgi:hypothetical protein
MSPQSKAQEESYALDGSRARIEQHDGGTWREGDVVTAWGIVSIYAEAKHTRYDFAANGRHYMRTEFRHRTNRGIAIEATKYARRCAEER